jgi:hypothetical protein
MCACFSKQTFPVLCRKRFSTRSSIDTCFLNAIGFASSGVTLISQNRTSGSFKALLRDRGYTSSEILFPSLPMANVKWVRDMRVV